jgi:hypothetical protein
VRIRMIPYLLAIALAADPAALSKQDLSDIRTVTRRFIVAMVEGDRPTLRSLVPQKTENRYGPCPLTSVPKFDRIVVDQNRAGVYFNGGHSDGALPKNGLLVMVRVKEDKEWPWKVRTVIFYDHKPRSVRLPSHSITKEDVAEEPEVERCALEFIRAWQKRDYSFMERMSYRWVDVASPKNSPKVRVRGVELSASPMAGGEARVRFTAKLRLLRFIPYNVDGTLYAVKEGGEWKVRENSFVF